MERVDLGGADGFRIPGPAGLRISHDGKRMLGLSLVGHTAISVGKTEGTRFQCVWPTPSRASASEPLVIDMDPQANASRILGRVPPSISPGAWTSCSSRAR